MMLGTNAREGLGYGVKGGGLQVLEVLWLAKQGGVDGRGVMVRLSDLLDSPRSGRRSATMVGAMFCADGKVGLLARLREFGFYGGWFAILLLEIELCTYFDLSKLRLCKTVKGTGALYKRLR